MTLPEGVEPSGPTEPEATVTEEPVVTEPDTTEDATTVEEPAPVDDPETVVNEAASDAELRAWAKDNGIEDVPATGRLSAVWREQILAAQAAALEPVDSTDQETPDSTDQESPVAEVEPEPEPVAPVQPEFETGEYRSVFKAPNTFVSSQAFTA